MGKWDTYRVHRDRDIVDRTLKRILFTEGGGKPYELAISIIGDLIQFYSLLFRFIQEKPLEFMLFLKDFNGIEQVNASFKVIHEFVRIFDEKLPTVKFGRE